MRFTPSQIVYDFDNEQMKVSRPSVTGDTEPELIPMTLGYLAKESLLFTFQDEPNITGDTKMKRHDVALRVHKAQKANTAIELTAEEISMIKAMILKAWPPLVAGQAIRLIEMPPAVLQPEAA